MHIETLAVHAGSPVDPKTGAVTPPIHLSTTFERAPDGSFPGGFIYSRSGNPNRQSLEACLAQLEGGAAAAAFSSGQAATFAILQSLGPGDHVIAPEDAYYGTADLLLDHFRHWGLETTLADMTNPAAVEAAVRPNTRLLWVETPSNPRIRVTDIAALVDIARRASARVACDNTWATPMLQHPLQLGADLVMHATTKYLGGHSDILGGAVVAREDDEFFARIRQVQSAAGAVPSPFESWLVMRGIRTLPYRMRAHSANALAIARYLAAHPRIEHVYYPGLETDDGLCRRLAADVPARGDAVLPSPWRRSRGDHGHERAAADLHARNEPRRSREPDRAPRVDRRSAHARAGEPAPGIGRPRAPRGSDRGPGAGAAGRLRAKG